MTTHTFPKLIDVSTRLRESSLVSAEPWLKAEAVCLFIATPFLLLPTVLARATWFCAILLVGIWLAQRVLKQQLIVPASPLSTCWYLFGGMVLVGVAVSADMALTLPETAGMLLGFAWWRLLTRITQTKFDNVISILLLLGMAISITLMGLVSMEWPDKIAWLAPITEKITDGIILLPDHSTDVNANLVAATILLYLPLVISLTVEISATRRWLFMLGILLITSLLFLELLTQSRAGWVATVVGLAFLYALKRGWFTGKWQKKQLIAALFIASFFTLLLISQTDFSRLQDAWLNPPTETEIGSLHTLSFRQEMWRWGAVVIQDYPFTGVGFGTFRAVVQRQYPIAVPITYDVSHAHNMYLQLALDVGIPGLLAYVAMMLVCGLMCIELSHRGGLLRAFGQGVLASLVAYHVWGLIDTLPLGSKPTLIFWMLLGVLTGIYSHSAKPDNLLCEEPSR